MEKGINPFFTSDKVMKANAWLSLIVAVLSSTLMLINGFNMSHIMASLMDFLLVFCIIVIVKAYFAHEKNVMKGMMGFLLASCLATQAYQINQAFFSERFQEVLQFKTAGRVYLALQCLAVLMFVVITVSHFIINSEHHSKPKTIRLNQWIIVCEANIVLVAMVFSVFFFAGTNPLRAAYWSLNYMVALMCLNAIVCVESKLDAYRIQREAAGWTEKK